ncbi:MAG: hypothetical protein MRY83_22905 [Flavobacteriales bacterium]|nr:hypothetical protein [Flavobacteriales bacterium]
MFGKLFKNKNFKVDWNFEEVDSLEKARELHDQGVLEIIYCMPLEFGGSEGPENILYVPKNVKDLKDRHDKKLIGLIESGKNLNYNLSPVYKGKSFIPAQIDIKVMGDGDYSELIEVW